MLHRSWKCINWSVVAFLCLFSFSLPGFQVHFPNWILDWWPMKLLLNRNAKTLLDKFKLSCVSASLCSRQFVAYLRLSATENLNAFFSRIWSDNTGSQMSSILQLLIENKKLDWREVSGLVERRLLFDAFRRGVNIAKVKAKVLCFLK